MLVNQYVLCRSAAVSGQKVNLPIHAMFLIVNGVCRVEELRLKPLATARAAVPNKGIIIKPLNQESDQVNNCLPLRCNYEYAAVFRS